MSDARRSPPVALYAAALLAASLRGPLACDSEPAEEPAAPGELSELPPPGSLPQCAPYAGDPSIYGFCISKHAGGIPSLQEMLEVCGKAGEWELDCRHGWVSGRMNNTDEFSTEDLLGACGNNVDCTFELLDFRPADEPLTQMALCTQYAGKYARDCAGHAMQRWWLTDPSEEEFQHLFQLAAAHAGCDYDHDAVDYPATARLGHLKKRSAA